MMGERRRGNKSSMIRYVRERRKGGMGGKRIKMRGWGVASSKSGGVSSKMYIKKWNPEGKTTLLHSQH